MTIDELTIMKDPSDYVDIPEWRPIDTAPKDKCVLITGKNHYDRRFIIKGIFLSRFKHETDDEYCEYSEDLDNYFSPEGWYEDLYTSFCEYGMIALESDCKPTHWMPLPQPPEDSHA